MSLQSPDLESDVAATDTSFRRSSWLPAHCHSRLMPLAVDNARNKIDPLLYSVTVGGLSRHQIDGPDFRALIRLDRIRTAFRAISTSWR